MSAVLNIPSDREIEEFVRANPSQDENATHERELELKGLAAHQRQQARQQAQQLKVSRRDLDAALYQQQTPLFTAEAIVESIAEALRTRFGHDWPEGIPDYPRALKQAASLIRSAYENLEVMSLEHIAKSLEH